MEQAVKYKIAMVAACPFPANYGSPASIREMSISLAESGHEVHILTYPYGQDLAVAPATLHRVGGNQTASISVGPNWQKPIINLKMIFALIRLIRREQIDIIHAHNYEGALIGICGKWLTGRPLLYNAVNTMSDELAGYDFIKPRFLANWLAAALDWFVPKPPDFITAVSEELRDDLVRKGKPEAKIDCVPAGVHPELFDGADPQRFRTKLGLENAHVVMYTGTLDAFQRLDNLYAAFAKVVEAETNAKLLMVVPIPDDAGIAKERARIRELGIPDSSVLWEGPPPWTTSKTIWQWPTLRWFRAPTARASGQTAQLYDLSLPDRMF